MMEKEERIKKITEVAQKYEQVWKTCDLGGEDSIASIGTFIGSLIENADKRYGKDIAAFVAEILCDYANGQTDNFELTCKRKTSSNPTYCRRLKQHNGMRLHDVDFTTSEIMRRPYDYIIQELPAHNVGTIHFGRRWIVHKGWALDRFFDCFTFLSALGGVNEIPHAMGVFKTNHEAYQLTQKLNSEIVKNEEPETWAICKYTWQDVYKQTHKSK